MTLKEVVSLALFLCHQPKAEDDDPEPTQKAKGLSTALTTAAGGETVVNGDEKIREFLKKHYLCITRRKNCIWILPG